MRYDPPEQPTTLKGAAIGAIVCGLLVAYVFGPIGFIVGSVLGMVFGDQIEREMRDFPDEK